MGRSKLNTTSSSSSSSEGPPAIPFPHDGPIFVHTYIASSTTIGSNSNSSEEDGIVNGNDNNNDYFDDDENNFFITSSSSSSSFSSLKPSSVAIRILNYISKQNQSTESSSTIGHNHQIQLCKNLQDASNIKNQLHILHSYRSTILNNNRKNDNSKIGGGQEEDSTIINKKDNDNMIIDQVLYRLLLEWLLSYQTTTQLQRCIQSVLNCIEISDDIKEEISREVLKSILFDTSNSNSNTNNTKTCCYWKNPIKSIEVATHDTNLLKILKEQSQYFEDCLSFLYLYRVSKYLRPFEEEEEEEQLSLSVDTNFVNDSIIIIKILKILFTNNNNDMQQQSEVQQKTIIPYRDDYECYVLMLFSSTQIPNDNYNTLGILYGNLIIERILNNNNNNNIIDSKTQIIMAKEIINIVNKLDIVHSNLSQLARLSIIQGIAATIDLSILLLTITITVDCLDNNDDASTGSAAASSSRTTTTTPIESCWKYSLKLSQIATDPMVRWCALKGISTLSTRWKSSSNSNNNSNNNIEENMNILIQDTIQVVLQTWENPPLRKLAKAIPVLFKTLVDLLDDQQISTLYQTILKQPNNRKGKYLALGILLPYNIINFEERPSNSTQEETPKFLSLESLLKGIGDRGPNTIPIADLWIQVLQHLWDDKKTTTNNNNIAKPKDIDKKEQQEQARQQLLLLFEEWASHWIPSLASAVVTFDDLARRKQIVAFCIPRIVDLMKRTKSLKVYLPNAFTKLFDEINKIGVQKNEEQGKAKILLTSSKESLYDRVLWAHLELARHSSLHKLSSQKDIQLSIATYIPVETLRLALTHFSASIRLAAFQSLDVVCSSLSSNIAKPTIELEMGMWNYAFPYAAKTTENKDYSWSLLQYLSSFLDRLSCWEARVFHERDESSNDDNPLEERKLTKSYSFLSEFLLQEVALSKGGYPGTIADKEGFTLLLLDCILAFVTQDQSYAGEHSVGSKNSMIFQRRREPVEVLTMDLVLDDLLGRETFAALFALLHSAWDNTRVLASRSLSKLVLAAQAKGKRLPAEFSTDQARSSWMSRAVYLASSPRQREAHTGSHIIEFLHASAENDPARYEFLCVLNILVQRRLSSMQSSLEALLAPGTSSGDEPRGEDCQPAGSELPLAHGLIHAIRLSTEHQNMLSKKRRNTNPSSLAITESHHDLYENMIDVFCQGIQIAMTVVADVRDGEIIQEMEDAGGSSTPLNVNTGAIGANGAFSKLEEVDETETRGRVALQRVIIGSWLLMKEACAAVASVITTNDFTVPIPLIEKVGELLITTLTSLKHAGAAFAARDSLQSIATACLSTSFKEESDKRLLPVVWANRLLNEISTNEKVRDSTLRRSTGYALGFVALMRAEIATKTTPLSICPLVLRNILLFAQPPEHELAESFASFDLSDENSFNASDFFYFRSIMSPQTNVLGGDYEPRCRVHAFNILRLIILDAPIASAVRPYVGDAILSSILGYNDSLWAVRNSSTIVFSAAMLRVVDADKNASNLDATSSNAITVTELFRRYPPLASFLLAIMRTATQATSSQDGTDFQALPVLLLMSRIHPVSSSGEMASSLIESFPAVVCKCLSSRDHTIREAAARALANICTEDKDKPSSPNIILAQFKELIVMTLSDSTCDWNLIDGVLLGTFALVRKSQSARVAVCDKRLHSILLRILMPTVRRQICPPSSMATALETLMTLFLEGGGDSDLSEEHIITRCKNITGKYEVDNLIGGAKLLSTAAVAYCRILQRHLWSPCDKHRFQNAINEMESLLSSNSFDVRLAAVKCFKKCIYSNIDNLIETMDTKTDQQPLSREELLSSLCRMLLRCLNIEVNRVDGETGRIGPHRPTERRLSRCFLECFHGYCAVVENSASAISSLIDEEEIASVELVSFRMVEQESLLLNSVEAKELYGETLLSSNATEMLAVAVSRRLTKSDNKPMEDGDTFEFIEMFAGLVEKVNNQDASWRTRYNIAMSIETSQILNPNASVAGKYRQRFLLQVIRMLQDSDDDVRASACRTAGRLVQSSQVPRSLLPEMMVEMMYGQVFAYEEEGNDVAIVEVLIETLLSNCGGVLDTLKHIREEFCETLQESVSPSDLVNASTSRKIFEEGDYNPFQEPVLENQLICRALIDADNLQIPNSLQNELLATCHESLNLLLDGSDHADMTHDMTRHPTVLPSLHGLLLGVTVAVYFGARDARTIEVQATARRLAESPGRAWFHPDILLASMYLSNAKEGEPSTKESIASCLFLLKQASG